MRGSSATAGPTKPSPSSPNLVTGRRRRASWGPMMFAHSIERPTRSSPDHPCGIVQSASPTALRICERATRARALGTRTGGPIRPSVLEYGRGRHGLRAKAARSPRSAVHSVVTGPFHRGNNLHLRRGTFRVAADRRPLAIRYRPGRQERQGTGTPHLKPVWILSPSSKPGSRRGLRAFSGRRGLRAFSRGRHET